MTDMIKNYSDLGGSKQFQKLVFLRIIRERNFGLSFLFQYSCNNRVTVGISTHFVTKLC